MNIRHKVLLFLKHCGHHKHCHALTAGQHNDHKNGMMMLSVKTESSSQDDDDSNGFGNHKY